MHRGYRSISRPDETLARNGFNSLRPHHTRFLSGPGWNHPGMFFQHQTTAASALVQDGAVKRFCIRTYAALLVPWAALILPIRATSIKADMRSGYSLLVDEYRMIMKPLRDFCIFATGRFTRRCLGNSCDGVERILVTLMQHLGDYRTTVYFLLSQATDS